MRKLHSSRGETLVETLAAVLVTALTLLLLAAAIRTASKLNARAAQTDTGFRYEGAVGAPGAVTVTEGAAVSDTIPVMHYQSGDYRYYEGVG